MRRGLFDAQPTEAFLYLSIFVSVTSENYGNMEKFEMNEIIKIEIQEVVSKALDSVENEKWTVQCLSASRILEVLETKVNVSHIVMNAFEYVSIRKFDGDCLELITEDCKLKAGIMATIQGIPIVVLRRVPRGTMVFCSMDIPEFFRVQLVY